MHMETKQSHGTLISALLLILLFGIVEAIGGWWAHSLALLSDAGHMISDALALGIAAFAAWIAMKPPTEKHTYGYARAEVIAAWISSLLMLGITVFIIIEAIERIQHPPEVHGMMVIWLALLGAVVNMAVAWMLSRGQKTLNVRAALLHVFGDLLGSFAALAAGIVIHFYGWLLIDPLLSIFISILILYSTVRLIWETLAVLMEGAPKSIKLTDVATCMTQVEGVSALHDLHIWTLCSGHIMLSAHVDIEIMSDWSNILAQLSKALRDQFHIEHITLQPEPALQVVQFQKEPPR